MKVMVLNSSPRSGNQSKTSWVLKHITAGMTAAGAVVELFSLSEKIIEFCSGCFSCWTQTPGTCIHRDEMAEILLPKWIHSDIVVYATPLYFSTMNAQMKVFVDRTLPVLLPYLKREKNKTFHPHRYDPPKAVWVSVAGFPEPSVFDTFSEYLKALYGDRLMATIFRPASEIVTGKLYKTMVADVSDALRSAGRQLIEKGGVSQSLQERIMRPWAEPDDIATLGNLYWNAFIEAGLSPAQYFEKGLFPKPDCIRSFLLMLSSVFDPAKADGAYATVQFHFIGIETAVCHFTIADGSISTAMGAAENPHIIIETPFDLWMEIMTGKVDGLEMYTAQAYRAAGQVDLLRQMGRWFGG